MTEQQCIKKNLFERAKEQNNHFLVIYEEDTYPYEVVRHLPSCQMPRSDMTFDIEIDPSGTAKTWQCDMGEGGGGIIMIDILECECEPKIEETCESDDIPF